jgi:hypothetical protein
MRSPKTMAGPVCLWLPRHFLGVEACFNFVGASEGCHVRGLLAESVCRVCMDWSGKRTWHVGQVFPCRVYIDSNRRDSQI